MEVFIMGNVKKFIKRKGYESLNRDMLQNVGNLSLEAIGLLCNLTSYPAGWEVNKTELYKRFAKSGRRKVEKAWNELIEQKYIVQFKKRTGKKYDYIYYHNQECFTDEEIKEIEEIEECKVWDGKLNPKGNEQKTQTDNDFWTVQNEQSNLDSSKRTANILTIKEINYKNKEDTYKDTEQLDLSTNNNLDNEFRKEQQEKIYKKTLEDKMPEQLFNTLNVLSEDYDEMYKWYGILLRAKADVEKKRDTVIPFEIENITTEINKALQSGIRAIKKEQKTNPDNYLYTTIKNKCNDLYKVKKSNQYDEMQSAFHTYLNDDKHSFK